MTTCKNTLLSGVHSNITVRGLYGEQPVHMAGCGMADIQISRGALGWFCCSASSAASASSSALEDLQIMDRRMVITGNQNIQHGIDTLSEQVGIHI